MIVQAVRESRLEDGDHTLVRNVNPWETQNSHQMGPDYLQGREARQGPAR